MTYWRQWHQQIRNRKYYLAVAAAILRNGYDVIFSQWLIRFGRNLAAWCSKNIQITSNWSISKPEVEFQYGGRLHFETESSYISAANGAILTKFGTLIDFDLLKAVTSTNTKPELVFSVRGRHLDKAIWCWEMDMTSYFCSGCCDLDEIRYH